MRLAIQASDLDHARIDGTRVYLSELLRRFGKLSPAIDFTLYHKRIFNPALALPTLPSYHERKIPFPLAWMQTRLAWVLWQDKPEKLFFPIQAVPFFTPAPIEVTVTIHDLAFKYFPKTFPWFDRWKLNLLLGWAVRRANKIIAVSESTKRDLLHFFPTLPPERIRVIYHGFDAMYTSRIPEDALSTKLKNYNLRSKSYALYVGALQPRKNLMRLIEAFEKTRGKNSDLELVFVGEATWLSDDIIERAHTSRFHEAIHLTGRVGFEDLQALYQGARVFVFPSLYEGFGIPLLEAFAAGVPVLTAHNSSLSEVAGKAALFCDAHNVDDITAKFSLLWRDEALRTKLIQAGQKQREKFSWDKCAEKTLEYILE